MGALLSKPVGESAVKPESKRHTGPIKKKDKKRSKRLAEQMEDYWEDKLDASNLDDSLKLQFDSSGDAEEKDYLPSDRKVKSDGELIRAMMASDLRRSQSQVDSGDKNVVQLGLIPRLPLSTTSKSTSTTDLFFYQNTTISAHSLLSLPDVLFDPAVLKSHYYTIGCDFEDDHICNENEDIDDEGISDVTLDELIEMDEDS